MEKNAKNFNQELGEGCAENQEFTFAAHNHDIVDEHALYNEFVINLAINVRSIQTAVILLPINDTLDKMVNDLKHIKGQYPDIFDKIKRKNVEEIATICAYGMIESKSSMELYNYYHDAQDEENAMKLLDYIVELIQILNISRENILTATKDYLKITIFVIVSESRMLQNLDTVIEVCNFLEIE